ncbi:DUF262 domain-containing protein [Actinomyces sp. 2119]|uniref:DUF262 domain-containing protein n=1 Tax=Actinomyces sp. 2119 TaxID=2321393 RepID=UPI000E6C46AE|nr:DUF262 domain-containing protein [Actinomyces sp. 2119]RJF44092.1 DUF262 domain-containing protein [Actinomyces sp. 2119]
MEESQAVSTSQVYTIADLRVLVRSGRLRVPQFQRSFRWEARDVLSLLDSVVRGYPFGSLLLWKREAQAQVLRIGGLEVEAAAREDALWVVDGQQRITSLVNVVDPEGAKDPRFTLGYSLRNHQVVGASRLDESLVIPLPDLFDIGRALAWLADNPDASEHAPLIQDVAGRLNRVAVPATVMEQADESVLREVFDRINSRGKRLNAAEIFDAIHGGPGRELTIPGIAARVDSETRFGLLSDTVVVQALLTRRHPDITRDIHSEFSPARREVSAFPGEDRQEAYEATERALVAAVRFLQGQADVPHMTFLPFRFQLLVLTRFFALFPQPHARNLELLRRWLWRSSAGADALSISGSRTDLRDMAKHVVPGEESASVQRLLDAVRLPEPPGLPDLRTFRSTRADSKMILAAMWKRNPVNLMTGQSVTLEELATVLEGETTPRAVAVELAPAAVLGPDSALAANRVIAVDDRRELVAQLSGDVEESALASLLLDQETLGLLQDNRYQELLQRREKMLEDYLSDFLAVRTAYAYDDTPPLVELISPPSDQDRSHGEADL